MKDSSKHSLAIALALGVAAGGCATRQANVIEALWTPPDDAWQQAAAGGMRLKNAKTGSIQTVPAAQARDLYEVKKKIEAVSGVQAQLAIVSTVKPNAFTFERDGRKTIAISLSFLEAVGRDRDALATTMGHELGHVKLGHRAAREERAQTAQGASQVLGLLLGAVGVPLGGTIASAGVSVVATVFSRDEERAADEIGLKWAVAAGYDPCGAYRVIRALKRASDDQAQISIVSTHPSYAERSAVANDLSMKERGRPCPD